MFHEVDAALVGLIQDEAIGAAAVAVALDVPNRPWFAAVQRPTVNLFLYDVRENVARRDVMHEPVLDDSGRIVGRRAPARRYDLYYLLSVWGTPDPALEHRLMAALLAGLGRHDVIPEARVPQEHRDRGLWHLSVAGGAKRMMPGNFGGEMKLQAEVSVTVPLPPRIPLPAGPPTERPLDLRMSGSGGQGEQVQGRPPAPGDPGAAAARRGPVPRQAGAGQAGAGQAGAGQAGAGRVGRAPGGGPVAADDPARQREQLARAVAAAAGAAAAGPGGPPAGQRPGAPPPGRGPGAPAAGQRPGGPPRGRRPAGPPGAAGQRPPQDPMAVLGQALAQAAQAQAALAQAQAVIASALGRPPAAGQRLPGAGPRPAGAAAAPRPAATAAAQHPAGAVPAGRPAGAARPPTGPAQGAPGPGRTTAPVPTRPPPAAQLPAEPSTEPSTEPPTEPPTESPAETRAGRPVAASPATGRRAARPDPQAAPGTAPRPDGHDDRPSPPSAA